MSTKVGLRKVDFDKLPGGRLVRQANVFPATPLLSSNQWAEICKYYIASAPAEAPPQGSRPEIKLDLKEFTVVKAPFRKQTPMTTLVKIVPQQRVLFAGDSLRRALYMLNDRGEEMSSLSVGNPPVALDLRPEGMYLTLIGYVAPSDDPIGRYLLIPNAEGGLQRPIVLLDRLPRPCEVKIADLNGDRRDDLVVCNYGNILGRFSWYENTETGEYREHVLRNQPGALCAQVHDFNGDGLPDIMVLMGQAQEGVFLYTNLGKGQFRETPIIRESPVWGSVYFELADFNRDGLPDLVVANGDNAEYPTHMKNYHGIRIYLNQGNAEFREAYFFPLNGAYKAVARDFDSDGDLDLAAISFFPDYLKSPEESFVYLRNEGDLRFTAHSFPECTSGRWIVLDAGDLDGNGSDDIVLGAFDRGPETIPIPDTIRQKWQNDGPNVLILKNNRH
jgi:hypothetical protein